MLQDLATNNEEMSDITPIPVFNKQIDTIG